MNEKEGIFCIDDKAKCPDASGVNLERHPSVCPFNKEIFLNYLIKTFNHLYKYL